MNLMIVFGMFVCVSLCMSVCRLTVSKALDMSRAIASVLCGGFCLLNPAVIVLLMICNAVVVECCFLKPCWWSFSVMLSVMYGSIVFSSVFAIGDSSAIGLYDVPSEWSLFGLGMGIILATFQMFGIVLVFRAVLKMCVRSVMASGPKCLRCLMLMSSGPVELLFGECFIAVVICSFVIVMGSVCSLRICLSILLFRLYVVCVMLFANCLLNEVAFCVLFVAVLSLLKCMVQFGVCVGFLFASEDIVFQSLCESFLWFQSSVMCCFQSSCLCCCIWLSICVFSAVMSGCL